MRSRKFRDIAFILHRYIGLAVGLLIAFVGLTGSLLRGCLKSRRDGKKALSVYVLV